MAVVRTGLYLCLISILSALLLVLGVIVLGNSARMMQPDQVLAIGRILVILAWVIPVASLLGHALCCAVPASTGLLPYAAAALVTDLASIYMTWSGQDTVTSLGSLSFIITIASMLLFLLFLSNLAAHIGRPDLVSRTSSTVWVTVLGLALIYFSPYFILSLGLGFIYVTLLGMALVLAGLLIYVFLLSGLASGLAIWMPTGTE